MTLGLPQRDHITNESKQMWKCTVCENIRQWGWGVPEDKKQRRLLTCTGSCNKGLDGKLPSTEEQDYTSHVYHESV